eukprot:15464317-Alexandrium_andersonii.AAC.1
MRRSEEEEPPTMGSYKRSPNGSHLMGPSASCSLKLQEAAECSFPQLQAVLCSFVRLWALPAAG